MSRNLLRKTKRENVQTLLYQTLNFVRVVVDTDPYTDTEAIYREVVGDGDRGGSE